MSRARDEQPDVVVHIGEIVLHGVPVSDPYALGDAVRERLAELVTERGLPADSPSGPASISLDAPGLANGIAHAVWERLEAAR